MRVQDELVLCGVIEDSHLFGTDNYKPLLFDGMQPAYETVALDPAGKLEVTEGDIKDVAIQIGTAPARYTIRALMEEGQDHGDVMRSKAPKNILLGAPLSKSPFGKRRGLLRASKSWEGYRKNSVRR